MDGWKSEEKEKEEGEAQSFSQRLRVNIGKGAVDKKKKIHQMLGGEEINLEKKPCSEVVMKGLRT